MMFWKESRAPDEGPNRLSKGFHVNADKGLDGMVRTRPWGGGRTAYTAKNGGLKGCHKLKEKRARTGSEGQKSH